MLAMVSSHAIKIIQLIVLLIACKNLIVITYPLAGSSIDVPLAIGLGVGIPLFIIISLTATIII